MDSESTMLGFAANNDSISGNQVDAGSTGYYNQVYGNAGIAGNQVDEGSTSYYNQVYGNAGISGLNVFDGQDSPKAFYILAYVSTII